MSLSAVLDELYGQPADFLKRLNSELLLHRRSKFQLARAAGMDYENVKKFFRGRRTPTWQTMIRLDEAMDRLADNG